MGGSRAIRLAGVAGSAAMVLSVATEGRASDDIPPWGHVFINPGAVWLFTDKPVAASGPGFELSAGYTWLLSGDTPEMFFMPHVGGVFRINEISDEDGRPELGYLTAGIEGGFSLVGLEVTYARRGQDASDAQLVLPRQEGVALAPYLSLGLFTIGPQWIFPLTGESRDAELGMHVGLKLPIMQMALGVWALGGMWDRMPSGRPLRVDGVAHRPTARRVAASGADRSASHDVLERAVFTDFWVESAALERAAVDAFAVLARDLERLGAEPALLEWCHRARADEERHTRACLELIAATTDEAWALDPFEPEVPEATDLARLAADSFRDGCYAEGVAAAVAFELAAASAGRAVSELHATIAREESDHAELGWAVVRFALERGGEPVKQALDAAALGVAARAVDAVGRASNENPLLRALGVADDGLLARAEIEVAHGVRTRLESEIATAELHGL